MTNKKRLLFVIHNMEIGGAQKSLVNLLDSICDKYDITLFVFSKTGDMIKQVPSAVSIIEASSIAKIFGLRSVDLRKSNKKLYFIQLFFAALARLIQSHRVSNILVMFEPRLSKYDYAISYLHPSPKRSLYGGTNEFVLKRVISDKKISFAHCDFEKHGVNKKYIVKIYSAFDAVAFCSQGCLDSYNDFTNSTLLNGHVVLNQHNYIDIIKLSKNSTVIYDKKYFNVVIVSRLTYDKGIDLAILSISNCIRQYGLKIRLHIVGGGSDLQKFKRLTASLGISSSVYFYGKQKNPYKYMVNASLLLLTSRHEAAPMVFGEAQILGLPILTTESTSSTELVASNGAGWVCKRDTESIVDALRRIISKKWILGKSVYLESPAQINLLADKQFNKLINEQFDE